MDKRTTIDDLWSYACSGNIKALKVYYTSNTRKINRRYCRFGTEHSLIMGAFRNNQFATVDYLMNVGETVTPEEQNYIDMECRRIKFLMKLSKAE